VKKTNDQLQVTGPILALDLGEKLVGTAISDEMLITTKRLPPLKRSSWKKLLQDIRNLVERFDAQTIVVGLPLSMDGTEGDAAKNVRRLASNLARSVVQPVYLQDERLTSFAATENLKAEGQKPEDIPALVDGEAAATILRDFLVTDQERMRVDPSLADIKIRTQQTNEAANTSDNRGGPARHGCSWSLDLLRPPQTCSPHENRTVHRNSQRNVPELDRQ
jgi:putative Holliday junction resolvase